MASAPIFADGVWETTTTTGTGAYVLGGANLGFRPFSAVLTNGQSCEYRVLDTATPGHCASYIGTYNSGANSLSRDVLLNSDTGSDISWGAGTRQIFMVIPSAQVHRSLVAARLYLGGYS